jgi:hypothetical protein
LLAKGLGVTNEISGLYLLSGFWDWKSTSRYSFVIAAWVKRPTLPSTTLAGAGETTGSFDFELGYPWDRTTPEPERRIGYSLRMLRVRPDDNKLCRGVHAARV